MRDETRAPFSFPNDFSLQAYYILTLRLTIREICKNDMNDRTSLLCLWSLLLSFHFIIETSWFKELDKLSKNPFFSSWLQCMSGKGFLKAILRDLSFSLTSREVKDSSRVEHPTKVLRQEAYITLGNHSCLWMGLIFDDNHQLCSLLPFKDSFSFRRRTHTRICSVMCCSTEVGSLWLLSSSFFFSESICWNSWRKNLFTVVKTSTGEDSVGN